MKKLLFVTIVLGSTISLTACGKDEECVCDNGIIITENDAKDTGATLSEACEFAEIGPVSCELQ